MNEESMKTLVSMITFACAGVLLASCSGEQTGEYRSTLEGSPSTYSLERGFPASEETIKQAHDANSEPTLIQSRRQLRAYAN